MQTLMCLGVVAFLWFAIGFSLVFGGDYGGMIGDLRYAFLKMYDEPKGTTMAATPFASGAGSMLAFAFFQLQFAAITPSLMTGQRRHILLSLCAVQLPPSSLFVCVLAGAFTDRMHFPSWLLFLILYQLLVYVPVAHWNWGGGFLSQWPVRDFAGGLVVHSTAGVAAFTCVFPARDWTTTPISWSNWWMLPLRNGGMFKRRDTAIRDESYTPHSIPLMVIGAGMLWFGFGIWPFLSI